MTQNLWAVAGLMGLLSLVIYLLGVLYIAEHSNDDGQLSYHHKVRLGLISFAAILALAVALAFTISASISALVY